MSALCGRVSKPRRNRVYRLKTKSDLRMMAIMTDGQGNEQVPKEFLETGRTGRRNAVHDILQAQNPEAAELQQRLQQLAVSEQENPAPSTSQTELETNPKKPEEEQQTRTSSCS